LKSTKAVVILKRGKYQYDHKQARRGYKHIKESISQSLRILKVAVSLQANPDHDLMRRPLK
jgi:hypothetical protein